MALAKKPILDSSKSNLTKRLFDLILGGEEVVTIQALLQDGVDINARNSAGHTPLLFACLHRRKKIVDLLIKSGANFDIDVSCTYKKFTVLHYASENGWTRIALLLAKKVPDLDARDHRGDTAMHHAARSGYLKIVRYLMKKGADINLKNSKGFTPLLCAAQSGKKYVVDLLLNSTNVDGGEGRLVYYASLYGWSEIVQSFVKRVPDLNKKYETGYTALLAASNEGHQEVVKCLVEAGADIYAQNVVTGKTALHAATFMGHLEIVKWLVEPHMEKVFDLNTRDNNGNTVLHCASQSGDLEIVKFLLKKKTDINVTNCKNFTPLLIAAKSNRKNIVDLLMFSGANINISNWNSCTLLHYASYHGWIEIVQSLVKRGWDLDARDKHGISALGYACIHHQLNTVEYLLQAGASWDEDEYGYLLLEYLTREEFIKLFIENGMYFKNVNYDAIFKISLLNVPQDVELCYKAIVNRFNNYDLPEFYKLFAPGSLPRIEKFKIASSSEVARAIEQFVGFEIQTKGHCEIFEVRPMALSVFSVKSVLEHYDRKKLELQTHLKQTAALDSNDKY